MPSDNNNMLRVGTVLHGTYRIDKALASGGFGNTYAATNVEFDERVAIKEFFMKGVNQREDDHTTVSVSNRDNTEQFEEQREKFKKEARRLQQMHNEHIVRVHDLFEENGTAYYVMDYVDGESLAERLKHTGKPLDEDEVQDILLQVLDALRTVHGQNIWHLDIKPANIMVDKQGVVKLIDFGASKQLNPRKGGATTSTAVSYTNGYAPLEQMEQNLDKFGPWTDLYAVGATLYNLITNCKPPMPIDIAELGLEAFEFPPTVSFQIQRLIMWLMEPSSARRPQTVEEVVLRMQHPEEFEETLFVPRTSSALSEDTVVDSTKSESIRTYASKHKYRWLKICGIIAAFVLVAGFVCYIVLGRSFITVMAANLGNAEAQYKIGEGYYTGVGYPVDFDKAAEWYIKAAEGGNAEAQYMLGVCYELGKGVYQDEEQSMKWYIKAAEQGNISAQYTMSSIYASGNEVVAKNETKSKELLDNVIKHWTEAANDGDIDAMLSLADYYDSNAIRSSSDSKKQELKTKAEAWYSKVIKLWKEAADKGDADAMYNLAELYERRVSYEISEDSLAYKQYMAKVQEMYTKAVELWTIAANKGDAEAQFDLGIIYYNGSIVDENKEKAKDLWRKAAAQGHGYAQKYLNEMDTKKLDIILNN